MSRLSGKDLFGQKRGKYTILGVTEKYVGKNLMYFVQCDCGKKMFKTLHHLKDSHKDCSLDGHSFKHTPALSKWWRVT